MSRFAQTKLLEIYLEIHRKYWNNFSPNLALFPIRHYTQVQLRRQKDLFWLEDILISPSCNAGAVPIATAQGPGLAKEPYKCHDIASIFAVFAPISSSSFSNSTRLLEFNCPPFPATFGNVFFRYIILPSMISS